MVCTTSHNSFWNPRYCPLKFGRNHEKKNKSLCVNATPPVTFGFRPIPIKRTLWQFTKAYTSLQSLRGNRYSLIDSPYPLQVTWVSRTSAWSSVHRREAPCSNGGNTRGDGGSGHLHRILPLINKKMQMILRRLLKQRGRRDPPLPCYHHQEQERYQSPPEFFGSEPHQRQCLIDDGAIASFVPALVAIQLCPRKFGAHDHVMNYTTINQLAL